MTKIEQGFSIAFKNMYFSFRTQDLSGSEFLLSWKLEASCRIVVFFLLNLYFSPFPTGPHYPYLFHQEKILSVDQYMAKGFERRPK